MSTGSDSSDDISLHLTTTPKRRRTVDPELPKIGTDRPLAELRPDEIIEKRGRGRPRTFSDQDVFGAIPLAIAEHGHHALTLAHVADHVGATPQALIRRFGSRDGMIQSYLKWNTDAIRARTDAARLHYTSPLACLYSRVIDALDHRGDEVGTGIAHVNMVAFWAAARSDPASRNLLRKRQEDVQSEATGFLEEAQGAGELIAHSSPRLAYLMTMAVNGTNLNQTHSPDGTLADAWRNTLDILVEPYRPEAPSSI